MAARETMADAMAAPRFQGDPPTAGTGFTEVDGVQCQGSVQPVTARSLASTSVAVC